MPSHNPAVEQDDFALAIVQLANLVTRRLAPLFEEAGLTPQQWAVISLLDRSEDAMSLAEIARAMLVSKQNMTGMIARLEQLGVIAREGDPNDLRSSQVQLTRRGRNLVARLAPAYEEWIAALQGELSPADRRTLNAAVTKLIGKLQSGPSS
jgi:MarR family transcriptional regulator, organic hydroperoxide resistance regulator